MTAVGTGRHDDRLTPRVPAEKRYATLPRRTRFATEATNAFPKKDLPRYLFLHLSAHNPGKNQQQEPTPVQRASAYCPSKKACTACEDWVQELAEGTASVGLPGAGWAHKHHAVL